jgi:hypothetical protein
MMGMESHTSGRTSTSRIHVVATTPVLRMCVDVVEVHSLECDVAAWHQPAPTPVLRMCVDVVPH